MVVEHNFKENIIAVLKENKVQQLKLDFIIQAGEQIAYFIVGPGIVRLTGMCLQ